MTNWLATISIPGAADVHVSGTDRDKVVAEALGYVPESQRDYVSGVLALTRWSWLFPTRRANGDGVTVVVEKSSADVPA